MWRSWWPFLASADTVLADGRPVRIQPITPAAKPLLVAGLARISPETSRRRFFTVRHRFSEAELDALTRLDGDVRYAVGATARDAEGQLEPVGVARFARLADAPAIAEIALLVVDAFQGQGVGRALLTRLARDARARGIARFRAVTESDNRPVLRLLAGLGAERALTREGGYLVLDVGLAAA